MTKIKGSVEFLDKIVELNNNHESNLIYDILGNREKPESTFFVRLDTFIDFEFPFVKLIGVNHIHIENHVAIFSIGSFSESGTRIAEIHLSKIDPEKFEMDICQISDDGGEG